MSRKESKGMFAAVLGKLEEETSNQSNAGRSPSPHLLKVAAGVRQMQERSDLAERLLQAGDQVVEIEPAEVAPSLIADRFDEAYEASAVTEILKSIRERGQIVPGLVRPTSGGKYSFQIVYGRRRLEAARQLGLPFRAVVRSLTDEQAIIFQGEENTAREDLSFIEKCAFALAQEQAGFSRDTICASLSTGKSHVSEMIKIAGQVPRAILTAIGKAPGVGRGRWEEFLKRYEAQPAPSLLANLTQQAAFRSASTDDRFMKAFEAMALAAQEKPVKKPTTHAWSAADRSVSAVLRDNGTVATLAISARNGPRFAAYIAERLDELYSSFTSSGTSSTGD